VTLRNLQWQLSGFGGEHAAEARWMGAVILALCLVLASLLTATRRPGWQTLGLITSLAYLYLGVAALTVPDQPGSWGVLGGVAALVGGLAYAALVWFEAQQAKSQVALLAKPAAI
jgi:drug/metabolite transporter (DMT)-like permease